MGDETDKIPGRSLLEILRVGDWTWRVQLMQATYDWYEGERFHSQFIGWFRVDMIHEKGDFEGDTRASGNPVQIFCSVGCHGWRDLLDQNL